MFLTSLRLSFGLCRALMKTSRKMFDRGCNVNNHTVYRSSSALSSGTKTIFALSSGNGKAGVAVIRISGDKSVEVLRRIAKIEKLFDPRKFHLRRFYDPETNELLDQGLVVWFKGPKSFTGEDCCELHIHGGLAVTSAVLAALHKLPNFVQAEPGEFTKRAFINGKCDLTAVEGIADLINAETEAQRKQALRQMDGELYNLYSDWRRAILQAVAHVEAFIDFGDDEIIKDDVLIRVNNQMKVLLCAIEQHLKDNRRGERLRGGVHVAILGSPNVGKSSLFNFLGQKPAAIVSPIAGTTRDVIELSTNIGGYPVLLSDTAGLHYSKDLVEKEGISRAIKKAREADLVIIMLDSTKIDYKDTCDIKTVINKSLNEWGLTDWLCKSGETIPLNNHEISDVVHSPPKVIVAVNKIDIRTIDNIKVKETLGIRINTISCLTGEGMENFLEILTNTVKSLCESSTGEHPCLTQIRHRDHLIKCIQSLQLYFERQNCDLALAAHGLHRAAQQLGEISGEITTEQILDVIFRDFCIGK